MVKKQNCREHWIGINVLKKVLPVSLCRTTPWCIFSSNAALRKWQTTVVCITSCLFISTRVIAEPPLFFSNDPQMSGWCNVGSAVNAVLVLFFLFFLFFVPQKNKTTRLCRGSRLKLPTAEFKREHEKGRTANRKSEQGSRNRRTDKSLSRCHHDDINGLIRSNRFLCCPITPLLHLCPPVFTHSIYGRLHVKAAVVIQMCHMGSTASLSSVCLDACWDKRRRGDS